MAEAVIAAVSHTVEKEKLREVAEVRISVGELQQVEHRILKLALSQLKPAMLKNAKFSIETTKAKLKCRICNHEWRFNEKKIEEDAAEAIHFVPEIAHAYIRCPKCHSPDFEISEGRGIWLKSIRGAK